MITDQQIIGGKKTTVHGLFCMAVLAVFYAGVWSLDAAGFTLGEAPLVFTRFLFFLLCIYTGRWLCQSWYLQNKLLLFILLSLLSYFAITCSWWLAVKYPFGHRYAGFTEVIIGAMPFFGIGLVLGMLLKLIRATMLKQVQDAQAAARQKQSELSLLQSQLSPHFLFNTLNNLYGISIAQHTRLPGLLLKLSDLLRYSVYDTGKIFVPLKEELAYIHNYIDFEKIRISDRLQLKMDIETVRDAGILVAPMLFIVFIENAFKHAKNTLEQKIYIDIALKISGDCIVFFIKNSSGSLRDRHTLLNESAGLGLVNTLKRLDLLYGNDYTLSQLPENDVYTVQLTLKIKHQ